MTKRYWVFQAPVDEIPSFPSDTDVGCKDSALVLLLRTFSPLLFRKNLAFLVFYLGFFSSFLFSVCCVISSG